LERLKKILKVLLITAVSVAVLLYGGVFLGHKLIFPVKTSNVPTVAAVTNGRFTFGAQAHMPQPTDAGEYVAVLAEQLKQYNQIAPEIWPGNSLADQSLIVNEIRSGRFWLIGPGGDVKPLTKAEASNSEGLRLTIAGEDITNYSVFERELQLGTYDAFIAFVQKGFRSAEQSKWQTTDNIPNLDHNEFLDNIPARAKRDLLERQLLKAVSEPGNRQLILDALATYNDWKSEFQGDYKSSVYDDRIEGTAYYFELVSCLYSAYPDQVKNGADLDQALSLLATRDDVYVKHGLIAEGGIIGGFACVLLDRIDSGWKEKLMNDPVATPMELLSSNFSSMDLPAPEQVTTAETDAVAAAIRAPIENKGIALFFKYVYDRLY